MTKFNEACGTGEQVDDRERRGREMMHGVRQGTGVMNDQDHRPKQLSWVVSKTLYISVFVIA